MTPRSPRRSGRRPSLAELRLEARVRGNLGRPHDAVALATSSVADFPQLKATVALWVADLLVSAGRTSEAITTLIKADQAGCAWEQGILEADPSLAGLHGEPWFSELVARGRQRLAAAQPKDHAAARPKVVLPRARLRGCVMAVHGRAATARTFAQRWEAALNSGVAILVPQSSLVTVIPDGLFGFVDPELAAIEAMTAYRIAVAAAPQLTEVPLVLAGMSAGAELAARWTLAGVPFEAANAFIAVAPPMRGADVSVADLEHAAAAGVRGAVVVGQFDHRLDAIHRFWRELVGAGIEADMLGVPAIGHEFPPKPDWATVLRQRIDLVVKRSGHA